MNEIIYLFSNLFTNISITNISIISIIIVFVLFIWMVKEPKSKYQFWSKQPMQKSPGKFPKSITNNMPRVYKQEGFAIKELRNWNAEFISEFSPVIYQSMCKDKDAIVLCLVDLKRNNIPVGYIYGQKQYTYIKTSSKSHNKSNKKKSDNTVKDDDETPETPGEFGKEIIYVGGLYLLPEYRGKGLAAILISNLVGKWWNKCNQFIFLHDKKILDNSIKPIQEKEIYIFCPWTFWFYEDDSNKTFSQKHKRYISFQSPKNDIFIEKDFGITYHIHGYSLYIHSMKNSKRFDKEMLMRISTKHPWVCWIYVPKEYSNIKSNASYKKYIYGYNLKGGSKKQKLWFHLPDI
jgi:hypothetical protein